MGTHRYPRTRRSPIEHDVGGYMRLGVRVSGYRRGSGKGSIPRRSRMVGNPQEDSSSIGSHAFVVNFKYSDKPKDGESVVCFSDNYEDARDEAWEERTDTRIPMSTEAVDPDLGKAMEWVVKRAKAGYAHGKPRITKATKLGAKYAVKTIIRGAKAGAKGGAKVARESYRLAATGVDYKLKENILRLCWQEDKAKQTAARAALKSRYPSVYEMCDFSPGWY